MALGEFLVHFIVQVVDNALVWTQLGTVQLTTEPFNGVL